MRAQALPKQAGVGFKPQHFDALLAAEPVVGFIEIHAENFMTDGGPPHAQLHALRSRYALSVHGVAMSIGSPAPLDRDHLRRLRVLCERYEPECVSEHLAWSSHGGIYYNDLLPLPYTQQTLEQVVRHIDEVQTSLRRMILIENPSTYVAFASSDCSEGEFLHELIRRSGCGLLLDVNNVFVSATNHAMSPEKLLMSLPLHAVGEIHLAGHHAQSDDAGSPLLIDSHDRPVADDVWALFESAITRLGPTASLIEWDNDIPSWERLAAEVQNADRILTAHHRAAA